MQWIAHSQKGRINMVQKMERQFGGLLGWVILGDVEKREKREKREKQFIIQTKNYEL